MRKEIGIATAFFFGMCFPTFAQEDDLSTKVEYTYFPQTDSDNSFRRFRARVNFPFRLGEREYILPGYEYRNVELQFGDFAPFPRANLDRFQSHTIRVTYTFGMKKDWRFAGRVGTIIASNFDRSDIVSEDVVFEGVIAFLKDRGPEEVDLPWRLVFGIHYSTKSGRPFPLPVVNYFKTVNQNWAYTVGVPESNLIYMFNDKNELRLFAELDGFYANIQNEIEFVRDGSSRIADDISMTVVLGGLRYDYYFTEHLLIFAKAGYTIYNDIRLRNEDKDDIYTINDTNTFYARAGIEFKL
jgi:hypothetical protein